MSRATHELSHWAEYDYIVVNQNVDDAFAEGAAPQSVGDQRGKRPAVAIFFGREIAAPRGLYAQSFDQPASD